ncbi:MAG: hypothetical protein AAFN27_05510 [Pseudomonadota bacterium]
MPVTAAYLFIVSMDVDLAHEDLFNEVYDTEHIPYLLKVPGVVSAQRMKGEPFKVAVGGVINEMPAPSPVYTAIYEIESPDVLTSPEWQNAVETGRWPSVRPYTSNRSHQLMRMR